MITSPRHTSEHPDRSLDCEEAVERDFQDLLHLVMVAGWRPAEALKAVEKLAWAERRTPEENAATEASIALARIAHRAAS